MLRAMHFTHFTVHDLCSPVVTFAAARLDFPEGESFADFRLGGVVEDVLFPDGGGGAVGVGHAAAGGGVAVPARDGGDGPLLALRRVRDVVGAPLLVVLVHLRELQFELFI